MNILFASCSLRLFGWRSLSLGAWVQKIWRGEPSLLLDLLGPP